ncbi:hypothetical protein HYC85_021722, partial [Camellia sinensis]
AVRILAKSPIFARNPRHIQFEADINCLFLYTSYNRLGRNADESDAEAIIDMAGKASFADQQKQVQENIHSQIKTFCASMDEILLPNSKSINESSESTSQRNTVVTRSGLGLAVGMMSPQNKSPGYTLELKPSQISYKDAGQGLFIDGQADVGAVIAFYPGIIYSPAYYHYIPGYPRVDTHNLYLITRYDETVINAQPWGVGGEIREVWDLSSVIKSKPNVKDDANNKVASSGGVLERRNPLAFAHYANHPAKEMVPNVRVCPYDFPLTEKDMRTYIPNIKFGSGEEAKMKRFGIFGLSLGDLATVNQMFRFLRLLSLWPLGHFVMKSLKNLIGYTLELKPSQISYKDAGQGLFIDGQADVGAVIAFYPGIIYSPAYYRYIPGYPRVDTHNPYLITRYDGTVINAQPWGVGGEIREVWDLSSVIKSRPNVKDDANNKGSDQIWKMLNKPLQAT